MQGVPGVLGLHIEGPHLNPVKKGIHDAGNSPPSIPRCWSGWTRPTIGRVDRDAGAGTGTVGGYPGVA